MRAAKGVAGFKGGQPDPAARPTDEPQQPNQVRPAKHLEAGSLQRPWRSGQFQIPRRPCTRSPPCTSDHLARRVCSMFGNAHGYWPPSQEHINGQVGWWSAGPWLAGPALPQAPPWMPQALLSVTPPQMQLHHQPPNWYMASTWPSSAPGVPPLYIPPVIARRTATPSPTSPAGTPLLGRLEVVGSVATERGNVLREKQVKPAAVGQLPSRPMAHFVPDETPQPRKRAKAPRIPAVFEPPLGHKPSTMPSIPAERVSLPSFSSLFADLPAKPPPLQPRTNTDETLVNPEHIDAVDLDLERSTGSETDEGPGEYAKQEAPGKRKRKSAGWSSELRRTKAHVCEECGVRFGSKQVMHVLHLVSHPVLTSSGLQNLSRHKYIHLPTNNKPHVCPYPNCNRRFSRTDHVKSHYVRTHGRNGSGGEGPDFRATGQFTFVNVEMEPEGPVVVGHASYDPERGEMLRMMPDGAATNASDALRDNGRNLHNN